MSIDHSESSGGANMQAACHFVTNIVSTDLDLSVFSDDLSVWTPTLGTIGKREYLDRLKASHAVWAEPFRMSILLAVERHNCVVILSDSHGLMKTGSVYENEYIFIIDFDGAGKIDYIREYFDVEKVRSLYRPAVSGDRGTT